MYIVSLCIAVAFRFLKKYAEDDTYRREKRETLQVDKKFQNEMENYEGEAKVEERHIESSVIDGYGEETEQEFSFQRDQSLVDLATAELECLQEKVQTLVQDDQLLKSDQVLLPLLHAASPSFSLSRSQFFSLVLRHFIARISDLFI